MSARIPQLRMRRSLQSLPELVVPEGYRLRAFRPDDAPALASLLQQNGELGEWSVERAARYFAPGSGVVLGGSFFVTKDDEPVATAQLQLHSNDAYAPLPELGWVAASPRYRGRGLGYVVCLAVMRSAAAAGHRDIFLLTDDHRLPAIRTYFKLGFEPWMSDPTAPDRWRAVKEAIGSDSERVGAS